MLSLIDHDQPICVKHISQLATLIVYLQVQLDAIGALFSVRPGGHPEGVTGQRVCSEGV